MGLKTALSCLFLTGALLCPLSTVADDLNLNTTVLGQLREDAGNAKEFPFNGYFGAEYSRPKWWNLTGETDMRLFHDFEKEWDDYDLYQAVVHLKPSNLFRFDLGRQFLSQGFSTDLVDGLKITWSPSWPMEFMAYSGVPRTVERGDFNRNDGLLSGLSIRIKDIPRTNLQIHTAWRKADILVSNSRENDAVLVGANASYLFGGPWKPLLYGMAEYNGPGRVLETGSVGFDLYPVRWAAFNAEFNSYNTDRAFDRRSILGLLTEGDVLSGRIGSTWTIIPDYLEVEQSYSYLSLEVNNGGREPGHLFEVLFPVTFDAIGLSLGPGYYFSKSYGGNLHGVRVSASEQFTKKLSAEIAADYSIYDKVTGDDDNAYSLGLWGGYEILKNLILSAGAEYNSNNLFDRDFRGSFKLQYSYGVF